MEGYRVSRGIGCRLGNVLVGQSPLQVQLLKRIDGETLKAEDVENPDEGLGCNRARLAADQSIQFRDDGIEHPAIDRLGKSTGAVCRLHLVQRFDVGVARRQENASRAERLGEARSVDLEPCCSTR